MTDEYPSDRSLGRFTDDQVGLNRGFDAQEAQIPWIDPHGHHQSLTWREHEEFEVTGCVALVMAGGIANQVPYRPLNEEDIRAGWDRTIRMSHTLSRSHAFDAYAAVGVHTSGGPIDGLEHLYSVLTQYAVLDEVVAISETGISMVQDHEMVTLEDQREIIRRQFQIAADHGIPVILHTPTVIKGDEVYASVSTEAHDSAEPLLDPRTAKLDAVKIDLEEARKTDIAESQIVFSHARQSMASWILENTECFVSFTVGNATRDIAALSHAISFAQIYAICAFLIAIHITIAGALRGGSETRPQFFARLSGMTVFLLGISYVFGIMLGFGVVAVYVGILADFVWRNIILVSVYYRRNWVARGLGMMEDRNI